MISNQVRNTFIDYFKDQGHSHVSSSSLVPDNDPTLMFANSGMVQFKNVFTGLEQRSYTRATTSQKCVRAGGKHNDLENVGFTTRHHTFFEMLGNFSFGDYFKEEAIYFAWDLITKKYEINPDKLLVTIYHDDEQAEKYWKKIAKLPDSRIIKISTSDNFWSMGDTGPCGPCSEIFFDHGEKYFGGPPGSPDEDGDRFIEIWNLVFMQYEQIDPQKRIDLPKPCVDTGMGLERITALLNGSNDNYSSDLFTNIINATQELIKTKINEKNKASFRVIADHLRASSFLIADGVIPSNEGRGYVLRRILRRGIRHAYTLGSRDPLFSKIFKDLQNLMSGFYDELNVRADLITETLQDEEVRFRETLTKGLDILSQEIPNIKNNTLDGKVAFKLYDTFGFPLDLTQDFLKSKNIVIDTESFNQAMEAQKEEARASWKGSGDTATQKIWFELAKKYNPTNFNGYEKNRIDSKIISILENFNEVDYLEDQSSEGGIIITENTCFYGESGGQVGDTGTIKSKNGEFLVTDTKKTPQGIFIHFGKLISGSMKVGEDVDLSIDEERRSLIMKNHSATHLLHAALRNTLGNHVAQRGSLVNSEKLRFDFSHNKQISSDDINKIQDEVNSVIKTTSRSNIEIKSQEDAIKAGAIALFGEKYGDEVRVLSMGDEDGKYFSTELCGGTHVKNTGDIGKFKIVSQSSIAAGVRRIEALRDKQLEEYLKNKEKLSNLSAEKDEETIKDLSQQIIKLGGKPSLEETDQKTLIKNLTKQLETISVNAILEDKSKNIIKDEEINGVKLRLQKIDGLPPKELRKLVDKGKKDLGEGIVVVFANKDDKVGLAVGVTDNLTNKFDAVQFVKVGSEIIGGKGGGGRKDFAQAGGQDQSKIEEAFEKLKSLV